MHQETTRPTYLEVSNHFFHDAMDFKIRYRYCMDSEGPLFDTPRSRRAKVFIDLRMGIESILKSLICYYENNDRKGKTLINWIEKYRHNIGKMLRKANPHIPSELISEYEKEIEKLDLLPVGLRYRFDTWDFRDNQETLYYETIGSDNWLEKLYEFLSSLIDFLKESLKKHNRLIKGSEIMKEIMEPRYRKHT